MSEKDIYISNHTRIKLSPDLEQRLLDINLGWRKKSMYYKAYFSDGHRFLFYAFSDGTFLLTHDNKAGFLTSMNFDSAYDKAKIETQYAMEYPEKQAAQYDIDVALGKNPVPPSVVPTKSPSYQPSTITPSVYSPGAKPLPPNADSSALYSAHKGIKTPPKGTIRLTKEDETNLESIGFTPMMVGNDVWYMHKGSGDTVKFFPNDTAKLLFTSKGSATKPSINTTIQKMLEWLPTRYSSTTTVSPIKSTSTSVPPQISQPQVEKGIKAGSMFDKTISDAGFVWDANKGEYIDNENTLKIFPNRASTLNFWDGSKKSFPNLASLINYLKSNYQNKKKETSVASEELPPSEQMEESLNTFGFYKQTPESMPDWFGTEVAAVYYNPTTQRLIHVLKNGRADLYNTSSSPVKMLFHGTSIEEIINFIKQEKKSALEDLNSVLMNNGYKQTTGILAGPDAEKNEQDYLQYINPEAEYGIVINKAVGNSTLWKIFKGKIFTAIQTFKDLNQLKTYFSKPETPAKPEKTSLTENFYRDMMSLMLE